MAIKVGGIAVKDVYYCFKNLNYNTVGNTIYIWDNWINEFTYPSSIDGINTIKVRGGAIWLTSNGDICYRFSPNGKVHTATIARINLVFTNFLACNFKIIQKAPKLTILENQKKEQQDECKLTISIAHLLLVEAEKFNPHARNEFYLDQNDGLRYRNTFKPVGFLNIFPYVQLQTGEQVFVQPYSSITLQYIYHISSYMQDRFFWLINWLASFFKNLSNRSKNILALYGDKDSGIDILFEHIITPLFGEEYTFNITDNTLSTKTIDEKLFYNLKNLSKKVIENEKTTAFLQKVLPENQKYAQVLITTEKPLMPYNNIDNFSVFYVSEAIGEMYIPDWINGSDKTKLTKRELIDAIASDLENFANILKLYPSSTIKSTSFRNDDRSLLLTTLEDKLKSFVDAIKRMDMTYFKPLQNDNPSLYDELTKDFDRHLIKQLNLIKYFNILYPDDKFESSRTLMKKLRDIDGLFQTKNAKAYTAGKKYFHISI